jgi:hypothetical protein
VLIGGLIIIGAGALAVRTVMRRSTSPTNDRMTEERYRALQADLQATQSQLDELQSHVLQLENKLAFTQSLLESRNRRGGSSSARLTLQAEQEPGHHGGRAIFRPPRFGDQPRILVVSEGASTLAERTRIVSRHSFGTPVVVKRIVT